MPAGKGLREIARQEIGKLSNPFIFVFFKIENKVYKGCIRNHFLNRRYEGSNGGKLLLFTICHSNILSSVQQKLSFHYVSKYDPTFFFSRR